MQIKSHLIEAENLKGLLVCPVCILLRHTLVIHKDEVEKIC